MYQEVSRVLWGFKFIKSITSYQAISRVLKGTKMYEEYQDFLKRYKEYQELSRDIQIVKSLDEW